MLVLTNLSQQRKRASVLTRAEKVDRVVGIGDENPALVTLRLEQVAGSAVVRLAVAMVVHAAASRRPLEKGVGLDLTNVHSEKGLGVARRLSELAKRKTGIGHSQQRMGSRHGRDRVALHGIHQRLKRSAVLTAAKEVVFSL